MAKVNTDHVVVQGGTFWCRHCDTRYTMALPCPIDMWVAASKVFIKTHENCQPPEKQE